MRRLLSWVGVCWVVSTVLVACASGPTHVGVSSTSSGSGTVVGVAVVDAGCPVVRPGTPCPQVPLTRSYAVIASDGVSGSVARVESTVDGGFRLVLPVGRYSLRGEVAGGIPRGLAVEVEVRSGQTARITLVFDSGVRAATQ